MATLRQKLRDSRQSGATLVELSIVLTLVLLLTIGVVDFGMGIRAYHSLAYAAREGTRYASVRSSESSDPATSDKITSRVRSHLVLYHEASNLQVTTQWLPANTRGGAVRVVLTYLYQPITPLLPFNSILLTSTSQMVISE